MAYTKNDKQPYSTKEKMEYHTICSNKGVDGSGKHLTLTQRVRHAMLAERCRKKIGRYYDNKILRKARKSKA